MPSRVGEVSIGPYSVLVFSQEHWTI